MVHNNVDGPPFKQHMSVFRCIPVNVVSQRSGGKNRFLLLYSRKLEETICIFTLFHCEKSNFKTQISFKYHSNGSNK